MLAKARHELWADGYVVEEARRNLAVKAPDGVAVLDSLLAGIHLAVAVRVERKLETKPPLPEKDQPVLAAAIHCACEALVTGDSTHFGALFGGTIQGVVIHSPRSIAELLLETR
jgi:hypothetical protein